MDMDMDTVRWIIILIGLSMVNLIAVWCVSTDVLELFNTNRALQSRIRSVEYRHWEQITKLEEQVTKLEEQITQQTQQERETS